LKITAPKIPPILRREPKLKPGAQPPLIVDDGDIPKAIPLQEKKPVKP
jgi:hypothetical protein